MKTKTRKIVSSLVFTVLILFTMLTLNSHAAATTLPTAVDGVIKLTEDVTLTAGYVVSAGENLKIDLAGHTLTTATGVKADTIYVEKGATLTITGDGTITNNAKGYGALFNNGTTTIDGATLKRDTTGDNNWYVICNHGNMTIKDAKVSVNGTGSSLVENGYYSYSSTNARNGYVEGTNEPNPTLVIEGGLFDGGMNTIKNDDGATLTVNGGTYQNNYQVSIMNWNIATINGGTFKTPTGNDKTNIFVGNDGANSVNKGILKITGGTFEAEHLLEGYTGVVTPVEITGGIFNYTKSFLNEETDKIHDTLVNANGVNITGKVTAPVSVLKYAKSGAVVTITDEVKVGDEINIAEGVKVVLPNTENDKVVVKNPDGSYTIEYKDADYSKVDAAIKKVEALNKDDYKDFSKVEAAVNAVVRGKNVTEQKVVDNYAKAIEEAIKGLEKKEEINKEDIKNPQTSDNILTSVAIGLVGIVTIAGIAIYKKQK